LPSSSFRRTASMSIGIGGGVRRRGGIPVILPPRSDTAAADGDPGNVGLERRHGKLEAAVSGSKTCGNERDPAYEGVGTTAGWGGSRNVSAIESSSTKTDIVEPRWVHSKVGGIRA
jgi:hypothetical protein